MTTPTSTTSSDGSGNRRHPHHRPQPNSTNPTLASEHNNISNKGMNSDENHSDATITTIQNSMQHQEILLPTEIVLTGEEEKVLAQADLRSSDADTDGTAVERMKVLRSLQQQPLQVSGLSTNTTPIASKQRRYRMKRNRSGITTTTTAAAAAMIEPSQWTNRNVNEEDDDFIQTKSHRSSLVMNDVAVSAITDTTSTPATTTTTIPVAIQKLSQQDVALCQALDLEYERAIEERQVAWTARYQSVRQSTVLSILFMIVFICIGTVFFIHQASQDNTYWSVSEGLLFSIYTITTVGYGHLDMPNTNVFQWYIIIYIFVGIATLTILVAQIYQCIALETNRVAAQANDTTTSARQQRSRSSKMRLWLHHEQQLRREQQQQQQQHQNQNQNHSNVSITNDPVIISTSSVSSNHHNENTMDQVDNNSYNNSNNNTHNDIQPQSTNNTNAHGVFSLDAFDPTTTTATMLDWVEIVSYILQMYDTTISFLRENEYGRGISIVLPFVVLITIGAVVIGPIEGWTITESIYFSVVSLTTVGFGDYYPTKNSSIWFCCIWLPFSVGFMSLYLGNVAAFYIRLSDRNIERIENVLRKRIQSMKDKAQLERRAVLRRALRGQQQLQQQQHVHRDRNVDATKSVASNDQYSIDGGSSTDDDLVFTASNMEEGTDDASVTDAKIQNGRNASIPKMNSKSMRLSSKRFFGFNTIPTDDRFDSDAGGTTMTGDDASMIHSRNDNADVDYHHNHHHSNVSHRRKRILRNSQKHMEFARHDQNKSDRSDSVTDQQVLTTMKDVLRSVHQNNRIQTQQGNGELADTTTTTAWTDSTSTERSMSNNSSSVKHQFALSVGPESEYLSVRSYRTVLQYDSKTIRKKPSFALRALVQERFAEIIAIDIAGYQSCIEIKDCTFTVTMDELKKVAEKWLIPRRARRAFRAVAFEALYFVGEHGLITRGAEALFSLSPIEFHQIFSPLLASFGDAESMESWLEHTQALADVDLSTSFGKQSGTPIISTSLMKAPPTRTTSNDLYRSNSLPLTVMVPSRSDSFHEDLPEIA
jgi:Ion channel